MEDVNFEAVVRPMDFLLAGAPKTGTKSLHRHLREHPGVFLPEPAEIRYFTNDAFYAAGEAYLRPFFSAVGNEQLIGATEVDLLYRYDLAGRVHEYNPAMRLLALIRNPIDRAYSAYWFARQNGWEDSATFEEALEREPDRRRGAEIERTAMVYLGYGHYYEQLQGWLERFSREAIHVAVTADLRKDAGRVVREILRWLVLDPAAVDMDTIHRRNVTGRPRVRWFQHVLRSRDTWYRRMARRITSHSLRVSLQAKVVEPLSRLNVRHRPYPPMKPETRRRLRRYFAQPNDDLAAFLGRDLSQWR